MPLPDASVDERQLRQLCTEIDRKLRAGESCRPESFLDAFPTLAAHENAALDLIYCEYLTRLELYQQALADELLVRFPQWRDALARQFQVDRLLEESLPPGKLPPDLVGYTSEPVATNLECWRPYYEILQEINRGAMGVVYLAWHRTLRRLVALKMMVNTPCVNPEYFARFRVEAEAVARLQHPHVVEIYEVGVHENQPYLVLEYVSGGTLAQRLATGQAMPFAEIPRFVAKLARAVDYVHQRGIIHRDLVPGNVLLTDAGEPKLSDFGLAKLVIGGAEAEANAGELLGTPYYMAPEQASRRTDLVGPTTDVYGLGAILYELLAGRPPFQGTRLQAVLEQVQCEEPPPPSELRPSVPMTLEAICLRCLRKEPRERYASAAALADALLDVAEC